MSDELIQWLDRYLVNGRICVAKRLAGNDTLATGSHQAGPYLPKNVVFRVCPKLDDKASLNPKSSVVARIDSHGQDASPTITYYNNRFAGPVPGTRNETRLTGFGGHKSALLDPENTGAAAVFSFGIEPESSGVQCRIWVSRSLAEDELIEQVFGTLEPGRTATWPEDWSDTEVSPCWLTPSSMPAHWLTRFPSAAEIVAKSVELRAAKRLPCDQRLMQRRDCEFEIFRSVEHALEMPTISQGFATMEQFLEKAQTLLQRRKSRSGRSLELQTRAIFLEENLRENTDFTHQPVSEGDKRPDFLFPSQEAYQNPSFPAERLRMLAVKTTCRDRWRQVTSEADRIETKHLLTLQEGVSITQFQEMKAAKVQLVVPAPLVIKYPKEVRPELITLSQFIGEIRQTV